tara:strand:- start:549 stop:869 length:321 start_codon:yes stop_codon:yes gene_type:complete
VRIKSLNKSGVFHEARKNSVRGKFIEVAVNRTGHIESTLEVGLIVPKKVCKRSVDRNRIKRQLRENIRNYSSKFDCVWIVIRVVNCFSRENCKQVSEELKVFLNQA